MNLQNKYKMLDTIHKLKGSFELSNNTIFVKMIESSKQVMFWIILTATLTSSTNKTYNNPVTTLDILPTCIALAGGDTANTNFFDGVNLIPYLLGENKNMPHEKKTILAIVVLWSRV